MAASRDRLVFHTSPPMQILQSSLAPATAESGVLVIHLLNQCNLHCRHCYMSAVSDGGNMLPADLVCRVLSEAKLLGIHTVHLTGGEPFVYPDLRRVLEFAADQQEFQLFISTNGTRIGGLEAQWIRAAGAGAQISIDGPEEYHDRFRGMSGAFAASSQAIPALIAAGVPVTVVITITRDNLDCLPSLAEWALRNQVGRISVQPLQAVGRGSHIADSKLSEQQVCTLFARVSDLGHAYAKTGLRFSLHYKARSFLLEHPCAAYVCNGARCHRLVAKEVKRLIIREDGTVLPEIATLNPRFALGNVRETHLPDLVKNYFSDGYAAFQDFCRAIYDDVVPGSISPIIAWDEIVSERSWDPQYKS
jgi:MoaA/NifB/PqqE/SkfB family radical SAM enzyme